MEKKFFLLSFIFILVVLSGSVALALDPMGPPTTGLKKGQWNVGIEYFYEDGKLKLNNGRAAGSPDVPITVKPKVHMVTANLGYGICDNWGVFFRIGSGVEGKASGRYNGSLSGRVKFDGDSSFVIGFGTKVNFYEQPKLKVGGLFQMSWSEHDGEMMHLYGSGSSARWSADVSTVEAQFAVGPTYQWRENVAIYGGPFFNYIDGKAKGRTGSLKFSYDIDDASYFGGYVGTQVNITDKISYYIEYLHTATDDAIGMGLTWWL